METSTKTILDELNKYMHEHHQIQLKEEEFFNSRLCKEFDVNSKIGNGGFGAVLSATNKVDNYTYAVKLIVNFKLKNDEIMTLSRLDHSHIVQYKTSWVETFGKSCLPPNKSCDKNSHENSKESSSICFVGSVIKDASYKPIGISNSSSSEENSESSSNGYAESKFKSERKLEGDSGSVRILFIQQELCDNSLRDLIDDATFFNAENHNITWNILSQIFEGVAFIHSKNIIHRDLNPRNIFFKKIDDGYQIKIGDFGLAKFYDQNLSEEKKEATHSNFFHTKYVGTSYYIAPEVKNSKTYDHKCDSYSLGIIMFEMFYPLPLEMQRDDILSKLIIENENCDIKYPDDFHSYVDVHDKRNIDLFLKDMLQRNPENRRSVEKLSPDISGYRRSRLFVKSDICNNMSSRFRSMQEEILRRDNYEDEKFEFIRETGTIYDLQISDIYRKLEKIFHLYGINQLPGNFHLSSSIEKHIQNRKFLECEWFGYCISKHPNIDNAFAQITEKHTNSRTFAWGQMYAIDGYDKYGVVDYIAPAEYAATIGAEILFLMTKIPQCLPHTSEYSTLYIGHVGIFKAVCNCYKIPFQKVQEILENELLSELRDKASSSRLANLLIENNVDEQGYGEVAEILKPQKDFQTFKNTLSNLYKRNRDQTILITGLVEIQKAVEKFTSNYAESDVEILYCGLLSYRSEFYADGLSYVLQYEYLTTGDLKLASKIVCGGGRYDTYMNSKREEKNQIPLCAYGINIYVDRLVSLNYNFQIINAPRNDILIYPDKWENRAFKVLSQLQKHKLSSRIYYGKNVSDELLLEYCKENYFYAVLKITDNENVALYRAFGFRALTNAECFSENEDYAEKCKHIINNLKNLRNKIIYLSKKHKVIVDI